MTAQMGDFIRYAGENCPLFANPLEGYFEVTSVPRPEFEYRNSACWRGYVASWKVVGDVLQLTGIRGRVAGLPFGLRALFPAARRQVRADWVTDVLRVPRGEETHYVHMGYDSTYERDLYLQVWGGRVVLIEEFENPPPEPEWEAGDTDDTFGRRFQRYIDWGNAPARQLRSEVTAQLEAVFGSDEAAFLRAVRAEPSARTPRLVYADWLDDRGDPRAGFIRHEEARPPAGTDPDATAEWERVRAEQLRRVKHWLWVKLMGYPLPKTRWGAEMTEW